MAHVGDNKALKRTHHYFQEQTSLVSRGSDEPESLPKLHKTSKLHRNRRTPNLNHDIISPSLSECGSINLIYTPIPTNSEIIAEPTVLSSLSSCTYLVIFPHDSVPEQRNAITEY